MPQFVFNSRDPIVVGVMVEAGIVREGTPICVPSREVSKEIHSLKCSLKIYPLVFLIWIKNKNAFEKTFIFPLYYILISLLLFSIQHGVIHPPLEFIDIYFVPFTI